MKTENWVVRTRWTAVEMPKDRTIIMLRSVPHETIVVALGSQKYALAVAARKNAAQQRKLDADFETGCGERWKYECLGASLAGRVELFEQ